MAESRGERRFDGRRRDDFDTRLALLEGWRVDHERWAREQGERLDVVWDWRNEVRPMLRNTNRLLWAVLGALIANAGLLLWVHAQ